MIIYRVEDDKGISCYNYKYIDAIGILIKDENWYCDHDTIRPLPFSDKKINRDIREEEICGFISVKQALNWFSIWELKRMKKLGLKLRKINVQKITAIGQSQCLAIK